MEELTRKAVETALSEGATYADIRIIEITRENITTRNGKVRNVGIGRSKGFGIRVIVDGAWGFSSHYELTPVSYTHLTLPTTERV